ncbi:hypothetical protein ACIQVT_33685 [Streptomyces sp. NPDC100445]|uniref:hypothetical protein n=1 Tax=Streptomyces sp. NPDC100445 TaxID=3366102 RepID=UPI003820BB72
MRKFPGTPPRTTAAALARAALPGAGRHAGPVAYDGGRGRAGDALMFRAAHRRTPVAIGDPARPADDVPDATINDLAGVAVRRVPVYADALGRDHPVSDLGAAVRDGGDRPGRRLVSHADAAWAGALSDAVDAR